MSGEKGAKPDELTWRLMRVCNSRIDDGKLKQLFESTSGHTLAEVEEYVKLWRHVDGIGEPYVCKYSGVRACD